MTTLLATAPAVEVEIKGAVYSVEAIPAGECGQSAVRVTKLVNGESYDVIRTNLNVVECSCPDFVCRHEGKGTVCKHGAAMVARGFLPVALVRPTVRPITRQDIAAARTWGLKLPAVPLAEIPAPAPIVAPVVVEVAPVVETLPANLPEAIVEPTVNPRDGWGPETDADTWELGPEPSDINLSRPTPVEILPSVDLATDDAPHGLVWAAITPAVSVLKCKAPDHVEYPAEPVEVVGTYRASYLPRFAPTLEDDAERLGYALGNAGEPAGAPEGWDFPRLVAFYGGFLAGQAELQAETLADLQWIDERNADAFGDPSDRFPECERRGCSGHASCEC